MSQIWRNIILTFCVYCDIITSTKILVERGRILSLYDIIPENLFSVLASKNKSLYSNALFVVLDAFKTHLKIPKDELSLMIQSRLESDIDSANFDEEEIYANETGLSGKAHFLIRKLKETGWIIVEYEDDFKEYVTVPNFSYKIIQTLYDITHATQTENFAYVYSTYSSLKTSNETKDPKEMVTALNDAEKRTKQLVESLTAVFHDIKYYNQRLVDRASVNQVLLDHFDYYQQEVVETILFPLKVKDSVPKYKLPIKNILQSWLAYKDNMDRMVEYLQKTKGGDPADIQNELCDKIYFILSTYDMLETDYIDPIDERNRRYTRSTAQKIDYLINSDRTIKGTLVSLLHSLSDHSLTDERLDKMQDLFSIYEQDYLSPDGMYHKKKGKPRERRSELIMSNDREEFQQKAQKAAKALMDKRYSREKVNQFVMEILGDKDRADLSGLSEINDEMYVMTLLSVANSKSKDRSYNVEISDNSIKLGDYEIPQITYIRRKPK